MLSQVYLNNQSFDATIDGFFEDTFLKGVVSELRTQLSESTKIVDVYFYININALHTEVVPLTGDALKVCIIIDEYYAYNEALLNKFDLVFQAYITDIKSTKNYFHFPLGFSKNLKINEPVKPIDERKVNVFYSGNLHLGRKSFYKAFTVIGSLPFFMVHRIQKILNLNFDNSFQNSYIKFTNGFGKGLTPVEYSDFLSNSKIVLCPDGISNMETYRLYEALKAGCIVLTAPLPDKPFYKEIPVIQLKDWKGMFSVVNDLLASPSKMKAMQEEVVKYWEDKLSSGAVARYIAEKIDLAGK